jgi:hypothetical protein
LASIYNTKRERGRVVVASGYSNTGLLGEKAQGIGGALMELDLYKWGNRIIN